MKLRNKQSKKIYDSDQITFVIYGGEYGEVEETYLSLDELNQDWEEVKPKEPLIKDEKIRKAVRAWAEANKLNELYIASNGYEIYGGIDDTVMQFVGEPLPHDNKDKTYTIEELCGEEEE